MRRVDPPKARTAALLRLAIVVGLFAFGGGFAIIANIKQRVVDDLGWMSAEEFAELMAVTAALPGTNAANLLTLVGIREAGSLAGAVACGLFLLPGIVLMFIFAVNYERVRQLPAFGGAFEGITAAVVGIVAAAADELRPAVVKRRTDVLIVVVAFAVLATHLLGLFEVVLLAGAVGIALERKRRGSIASGFWLGAPAMATTAVTATKLGSVFFSFAKVSLATFGGGVAMIPAVEREVFAHGWVGGAAFTDAIAFSQITPGPLAVCGTFLGYRAAGPLGALAATLGIFGPPLVITLVVGRRLPALREKPVVRGFLAGVGVAVVAAIAAAALAVYRVGVHGALPTLFAAAVFGWRRARPKDNTLLPVMLGGILGAIRSLLV